MVKFYYSGTIFPAERLTFVCLEIIVFVVNDSCDRRARKLTVPTPSRRILDDFSRTRSVRQPGVFTKRHVENI